MCVYVTEDLPSIVLVPLYVTCVMPTYIYMYQKAQYLMCCTCLTRPAQQGSGVTICIWRPSIWCVASVSPGLPSTGLVVDASQDKKQLTASVTTAKTTLGHSATVTTRDNAFQVGAVTWTVVLLYGAPCSSFDNYMYVCKNKVITETFNRRIWYEWR